MEFVRIGDGSFAHECRDDGNLRRIDDVFEILRRFRQDDTAADEEDRFLAVLDHGDSPVDVISLSSCFDDVARQMDFIGILEIDFRFQGVFGNIDQDWTGPACRCDVKGFFQDARDRSGVLYQVVVLGNGRRNAGNIGFLEGIAADEARRDLSADDDHGDRVHVGRSNARNHVAYPWSGRGDADAGPAGNAGVAVCSVDRSLFMTGKDVPEVVFIHFFV